MSGPLTLRHVRVQGIAVLGAVFIAGALAGAAIEHVRRPAARTDTAYVSPVPTERVVENMKMAGTGVPVLYESLQLTPEQRTRIRTIMDANRPRTDALLHETWPQLRALLESVQRQVEQVLTPEQRARLSDMRRGTLPIK